MLLMAEKEKLDSLGLLAAIFPLKHINLLLSQCVGDTLGVL